MTVCVLYINLYRLSEEGGGVIQGGGQVKEVQKFNEAMRAQQIDWM